MRFRSSVLSVVRHPLALAALAGAVVLMSAPSQKVGFGVHDKEYYADPNTIAFVRPGLNINIVSAKIASDGTISVDYKLTDTPPAGQPTVLPQPLDLNGVLSPGPISMSFIAAYIPKGQTQFVAYTTRVQTSPITKASATQAGSEPLPNPSLSPQL